MLFTSWATAPSRPCLGTSPRRWQTLLGTSPTLLSTVFHINLRISAIITVLWEGYSIPHWKFSIGSCALEIYILHNQSLEQFSNDISDVKKQQSMTVCNMPPKKISSSQPITNTNSIFSRVRLGFVSYPAITCYQSFVFPRMWHFPMLAIGYKWGSVCLFACGCRYWSVCDTDAAINESLNNGAYISQLVAYPRMEKHTA